jgi:hypothetical protein
MKDHGPLVNNVVQEMSVFMENIHHDVLNAKDLHFANI